MADTPHPHRGPLSAAAVCLAALLCIVPLLGMAATATADQDKTPKGGKPVERYPPSFRLHVKAAIERGVEHLRSLQTTTGHWGDPKHKQAMGHTALPLLTMLKSGVARDDEQVQRAFKALRGMDIQMVYSVGLYLMALQASYQPKLDTLDTDVGSTRNKRVKPKVVRKLLSKRDLDAINSGVKYLLDAQNASGLWHYDIHEKATDAGHDLSNAQYALLGLRAAMDCGVKIPPKAWRAAFRGLLALQDRKGPAIELLDHRVRGKYVFESKLPAEARGFHYNRRRKHGPQGENTLWLKPPTGSMTTAGVACMAICSEGLWRSRKFRGGERKASANSIRDGVAWMQAHFSVSENPGHPNKRHHFYYLYGLERMGMLTDRRWIGTHDWYKEGADLFLAREGAAGGWGDHVQTSFAVLFLKRATRAADRVVTTD